MNAESSSARSAIIVVVDRFGAGYLGPYGNTWIGTPGLNRLASQGSLFEFPISDTPELDQVYRAYWLGAHALYCPGGRAQASLPRQLQAASVTTALLTDSPQLADHPLAEEFTDSRLISWDLPDRPVEEVEQTQLARLFAEAIEWLRGCPQPFLLWVHAQAIDRVWDAPMPLREQFADEEDPPPSSAVAPPDLVLPENYDPDELLALTHAYAGQVAVVDMCLRALVDAVDELFPEAGPMLGLTAPRGFPLGQHGRVGACGDQLYSEVLHVPLLLRHSELRAVAQRHQALVQPADLYATLLDWWGGRRAGATWSRSLLPLASGDLSWQREFVCSRAGLQLAIRTPIWLLIADPRDRSRLFVKPDDRWEVNEVADRCQEVADQLRETLQALREASEAGPPQEFPKLPAELVQEEFVRENESPES